MPKTLGSRIMLGRTLSVYQHGTAQRRGKKLKARRVGVGSLAEEQKLHLQEMERLDRETPLPSDKTRGFVFRR